MNVVHSRREGFALAGAVLAMVLVGAIVTGGFYAANQETAVTRSTELGSLAQYIAETGLETVVGSTSATALDTMTVNANNVGGNGQTNVQYGGRTVGHYAVTITRLTGALFVVRSTGTVTIGQAGNNSNSTRTVSTVVRLRTAQMDNNTAMQVYGDLTVGGTAEVNGTDTNLSAWSGCSSKTGTAAVTAQPGATISESGSGDIQGTVSRQQMDSTDFTIFGDLGWNDLTRMATSVYEDGEATDPAPLLTASGACRTSDKNNWGAPTSNNHACFSHFPIIWAKGDMNINKNGSGQGILLVEGNLEMEGQFEFYGPIVVRGTLFFRGGSQAYGSVFSFGNGIVGDDSNLAGNMEVQYSSCSIKRAVMGATGLSRGVPIRDRAWIDLTAVQNSY